MNRSLHVVGNEPIPGVDGERDPALPAAPPALGKEQCTYPDHPRNVYWETTIACGLSCQHCRAEAVHERSPQELNSEQARRLIDSVKELGSMLIFTGGDPLERPDLFELIAHARSRHVPVGVTPSTTKLLTKKVMQRFAEAGVAALGMSIDGAEAKTHDAFRGFAGTFDQARRALDWAAEVKIPVQVNTTVSTTNFHEIEALYELLQAHHVPPVKRWSLFLAVPTGRASLGTVPDRDDLERLYSWVYDKRGEARFHIGTVEAPQYRRFFVQKQLEEGKSWEQILGSAPRNGLGVRDGNGVVFVSHRGDVLPSGFVPHTRLGNVKDTPLEELYRHAPEIQALRDMDRLGGKCGYCEFRWVCGGSRARAASMTGDPLGEDPLCAYQPPAPVQ